MNLREIAAKKGLNYRFVLWCAQTGHDYTKKFGGELNGIAYMEWINNNEISYKAARHTDRIRDQEDFTTWLEKNLQPELGL